MTSIERLQISGIRSFNPDPSHAQTVYFQKPLTVILGKNGAGKTTIIEALLNACTGAMPPGSGGSEKSSFVYDPKVIGESEVKAQIRLIFTGKDGRNMQVIRSVQVTRSRNKTELKTLDNTIAYQDPTTGKVVSNTYRASDVDRVMPDLLGVSSSVLKYVVFCHQEESNWPLSPPKEVKEIFDDLFAATRYVATLEKLRKISQDKRKQLKDYEASLFALREHRSQAKELEENIARKEEVIRVAESRKAGLEPELRELRKAAASLDGVEQQSEALTTEAAQISGRMEEKRETIRRANLPPNTHTLEQMAELKRTMAAEAKKAESTVAAKTKEADAARQAARKHEEKLYSARAHVQAMEREEEQHRRNVSELRGVLQSAQALTGASGVEDIAVGEDSVDERSLNRIMEAARRAAQSAASEAKESTTTIDAQITEAEEQRQGILRSRDADAKEREMTEGLLRSLTQQMETARSEIQAAGGDECHTQLAQSKARVEKLQRRVEAAEEVRRRGEHNQRRQRIGEEFDKQNALVTELRRVLSREKQRAGQEGELDRLRERIMEQQSKLQEQLRVSVLPQLRWSGIAFDERSGILALASRAEEAMREKEKSLEVCRSTHATVDRRVAALEQKRANTAEQISQHESSIDALTAECVTVLSSLGSDGDDVSGGAARTSLDVYEQLLKEAKDRRERCAQQRHALEAMAQCYDRFAETARAAGKCEVCDRPFSGHGDLQHFIDKNEASRLASPQALADVQFEAARAQDSLQKLEAIQRAVQEVRRLRAALPSLQQELASVEVDLEKVRAERQAAEDAQNAALGELDQITHAGYQLQSMRGLMAENTTLSAQLAARERQIAEEKARAGRDDSPVPEAFVGKTYEELSETYEAATAHLHRLNEQLAELQRMESGSGVNAVEKELLEEQHAMYQLELAVTKLTDRRETLRRLNAEHAERKATLAALEERRVACQRQLEEVDKTLRRLREARGEAERTHSSRVAAAEAQLRQLEAAIPRVLSFLKAGSHRRLQTLREDAKQAEADYKTHSEAARAIETEIREAQTVLSDHSSRAAQADRVIATLELERSLRADEARLEDVEAAVNELKGTRLANVEGILGEAAKRESLPRLRELIRAKMSELERAQAQQQGSVEAMLQDVNSLKSQLALDKYAKIEKRYRSTFLKAQSEALSLKDADNYYAALEVGVQAYHKEKIAQINQIIGELWRQTYRGSDIDTVEIRSETETTSSTASRRSYTYRVVIKRGDSELDMRGRCSAGQKVLASIIIRLALSETFCFDCGVLALDEPTTNLDEDNARSLAESLRSLIELKRNVKNFQLIVITHDEQFVRALGGHHLDHFHFVQKDREGAFSIIRKRTFNELFS